MTNPFNPLEKPLEFFDWIRENKPNETPIFLLTGQAGTGKTFQVQRAIAQDPTIAILTATTGIAAVNLGGATTIHSLLKVFNEESLAQSVSKGYVQKILLALPQRLLVVDEAGMMNDRFMASLWAAVEEVNEKDRPAGRLGIVVVGDFAQLPPIPYDEKGEDGQKVMTRGLKTKKEKSIPWMFNNAEIRRAINQPGHMIRLVEIKRQTNRVFIEALNALRVGDGVEGVKKLVEAGVKFAPALNPQFEGTTLLPVNEEVDRANKNRLINFRPEELITRLPNYRWFGKEMEIGNQTKAPGDWTHIPEQLELKPGALVMMLNNCYELGARENGLPDLIYANGDTGIVEKIEWRESVRVKWSKVSEEELQQALDTYLVTPSQLNPKHTFDTPFVDLIETDFQVWVRLLRTGELVRIAPIVRNLSSVSEPNELHQTHPRFPRNEKRQPTKVRVNNEEVWVNGQILYWPMRLAWYTSIHKAQGLTLESLQVSIEHRFFGNPAMAYTAISRARDPEKLVIVGTPAKLAMQTKVSKEIAEFI